jgi:pyruvate dehydrogenase E2 component (dihydrolipoamide acetyltransferase)
MHTVHCASIQEAQTMAEVVTMPQLGSTMEEGLIVRWRKKPGDDVKAGEPLLEVETDKATMEVESPASGPLSEILAREGQLVPVRQAIAVIGVGVVPGVSAPSSPAAAPTQALVPKVSADEGSQRAQGEPTSVMLSPRARRLAAANSVDAAQLVGLGTGPYGRVLERDVMAFLAGGPSTLSPADKSPRFTPLAARIAEDLGVTQSDLALGLPGSRVRSADVLNAARQQEPVKLPDTGAIDVDYEVLAVSNLQKRVAENVSRSAFSAPHVTLTLAVDMTECTRLRALILPAIEQAYGTRVSFTDLIIRAAALALLEHPRLNASFNGTEIRIHKKVNIGVAVALEDGLVVPVLHDTSSSSVGTISSTLKQLVARARENRLTPDDFTGGTFTITNLGAFDIDTFDPIIVTGQAAILGVGRIAETPVVVKGAIEIRSMMNLCMSFDHRVTNGAPAARFLQSIKQLLEAPARLIV